MKTTEQILDDIDMGDIIEYVRKNFGDEMFESLAEDRHS